MEFSMRVFFYPDSRLFQIGIVRFFMTDCRARSVTRVNNGPNGQHKKNLMKPRNENFLEPTPNNPTTYANMEKNISRECYTGFGTVKYETARRMSRHMYYREIVTAYR